MYYMVLPLIVPGAQLAPKPVLHQLVQERAIQQVFNNHYLTHPLPDTPKTRAYICGYFLPFGAAVALESAVWVRCGGPPPKRLSVIMPLRASLPPRSQNIDVLRTSFELTDITGISSIAITTPERTIIDIARWHHDTKIAHRQIQKLLQVDADLEHAKSLLVPGARFASRARNLLREFENSQ